MSNLNKGREVKIYFNDAVGQDIVDQTAQIAMTTDAYKAVLNKVDQLEAMNDKVAQADITEETTIITGATPYKVYSFTLSVDFSEGIYTFIFIEEAPNVESLS